MLDYVLRVLAGAVSAAAEAERHPLFIAVVQLGFGLLAAWFLTEKWQRWRQRRDFQYHTMSKFSETSMEMFVIVSELLTAKAAGMPRSSDGERRYITQRVSFHSLEAEIMASFGDGPILASYYSLNERLKKLFDFVQANAAVSQNTFEPILQGFLDERKEMLGQMIKAMKFS